MRKDVAFYPISPGPLESIWPTMYANLMFSDPHPSTNCPSNRCVSDWVARLHAKMYSVGVAYMIVSATHAKSLDSCSLMKNVNKCVSDKNAITHLTCGIGQATFCTDAYRRFCR